MGCTALVWGKRVIPLQAGSWCRQKCKGCGTRRKVNVKDPDQDLVSCQGDLLGEAGPEFASLISILSMENEDTRLILFLVNTYIE